MGIVPASGRERASGWAHGIRSRYGEHLIFMTDGPENVEGFRISAAAAVYKDGDMQ